MVAKASSLSEKKSEKTALTLYAGSRTGKPAPYLYRASAYLIDLIGIGSCQFLANVACLSLYKIFLHRNADIFLASHDFESYTNVSGGFCFLAYFSLSYWYTNGQSLGKKICGLRVVSDVATELSFPRAALRSLSYPLSYLVLSAGFLLPLLRKDGRALHDLTSKTRVISP